MTTGGVSPLQDAQAPIGVFDSGLGGLSVLRAIRERLPAEDLLYVADAAHVPYGGLDPDSIRARARVLTGFLVERGAKAIVVACNTATAVAVSELRHHWGLPIIGMEPAIKPAVARTRSGTVGVLATEGTLISARFAGLLEQYAGSVRVVTQPCPGLVAAVEAGAIDTPGTRAMLAEYLEPLLSAGADTVILGCTHYPFLTPLIRDYTGPEVVVIDTGDAVARQVQRRLERAELRKSSRVPGREWFWSSGDREAGAATLQRLWGHAPEMQALDETPPGEQASW